MLCECFFFFQAEDGIRDIGVTGVQTCALPIFAILFWFYPSVSLVCGLCPLSPFFLFSSMRAFLRISCNGGLLVTNSLNFCLSGKDLISPSYQIGRASCRERV